MLDRAADRCPLHVDIEDTQEDRDLVRCSSRDWLEELCQELARRAVPYEPVALGRAAFLLEEPDRFALYFNRSSPSSYLRGHGPAIPYALAFMEALEARGRKVINGVRSFRLETSKVAQHLLLNRLFVGSTASGRSAPRNS